MKNVCFHILRAVRPAFRFFSAIYLLIGLGGSYYFWPDYFMSAFMAGTAALMFMARWWYDAAMVALAPKGVTLILDT